MPRRAHPFARSRTAAALVAAAAALGLGAGAVQALPTHSERVTGAAAPAAPINPPGPYGYYMSLGDSLSMGYQPQTKDQPRAGYNGAVLKAVRATNRNTDIRTFGCSGETSTTFLKGGRCDYGEGSQMARAEAFMKGRTNVRTITLSLGGNDVVPCARSGSVDAECIQKATTTLTTNLAEIVRRLRAAAPNAQIVVLDNYDVFLGEWVKGAAGQETAKQSLIFSHLLTGVVSFAAFEGRADVAKVSTYFHTDSWRPRKSASFGTLPRNVSLICDWTYYCSQGDIHPTDEGYARMATAVVAEL
ncbi:SGNH/GDSL hydrolase family protein [Janibacter melonis]|nr:SGNH/GDSL hydrolase family protein [Janibacter melonis]